MNRSSRREVPTLRTWWMAPNLLGLDAPVIAVLWQEMYARVAAAPVTHWHRVALFAAVWEVYLWDRWLDARHAAAGGQAARHRIHFYHPWLAAGLSLLLLPVLLISAVRGFTPSLWVGSAALAILTTLHFARAHTAVTGPVLISKEVSVGVIFALGVGMIPAGLSWEWGVLGVACLMFACVCSLNCLLISKWEGLTEERWDSSPTAPVLRGKFHLSGTAGPALALVFTAVGVGVGIPSALGKFAVAAAASSLLLWWVDGMGPRWPAAWIRVLADAVLLTPAPILILGRF